MTNPEKKTRIDKVFKDAEDAALHHRMEAFYIYCGEILGILETIDTCGAETKKFREKTLERLRNLTNYYKGVLRT